MGRRHAMPAYICSDIHGQYSLYKRMLADVHFSDSDRLYIIGDIIDRGPQSIEMLQDIMGRENVFCLLGNHELMMLEYVSSSGQQASYWCTENNGGLVTKRAFEKLKAEEQDAVVDYLKNLYLQIEIEEGGKVFLLSHSSFLKDKGTVKWQDLDSRTVFHTVWDSPWRLWEYISPKKYREDGRFHIIGHVPVPYISAREWPGGAMPEMPAAYVNHKNRIVNIDLGCAGMEWEAGTSKLALCCMDLGAFAAGDDGHAFRYYRQISDGMSKD